MKLDYLKDKSEFVSVTLLMVAVVAALLVLYKVAGFCAAPAKAAGAVRHALDQSEPDAQNLAAQLNRFRKQADALKQSNLFSPPATKLNPVDAVMGILGDEALINGQWYGVGDKVCDATILAVNPTSVEIEWNGRNRTLSPIDGGAVSGPDRTPRSGRFTAKSRISRLSSGAGARMVLTESNAEQKTGAPDPRAMKMMTNTSKKMSDARKKEVNKEEMKKKAARQEKQTKDAEQAKKAKTSKKISLDKGPSTKQAKKKK